MLNNFDLIEVKILGRQIINWKDVIEGMGINVINNGHDRYRLDIPKQGSWKVHIIENIFFFTNTDIGQVLYKIEENDFKAF